MSTGVGRATVTDQQSSPEALSRLNETVLAMIMARAALPKILSILCSEIEKCHPGLLCSVLLLDADGVTLRSGASPSLPAEYCRAIDGVKIGPSVGSCGTAAYRRQPVVVSDIATDPLWADFRDVALPHGLRACWSIPIATQEGATLGTFAVYYRESRAPDPQHFQIVTHATNLAGIAIEHDRAKLQLRAAEDRYRTLVERLPAITYIAELGADGPWHYVSPQIESILGFSPAEWLSNPMSWMNRIHKDDREIALAAERRFQETHELFQAEYRMFARDGRVLWFRDEAVMLHQAGDHPLLMQGVLYDMTEHKRLEDQLRQSQKMEAVGQLAGGVAHDFNNLLMLIQAHNERLRGRLAPSDPACQDALEIERAVTRAAALTRQLLAFGRKQVLQTRILDLNQVVAEVVKMLSPVISNQVELSVRQAPSLGRVKADSSQIEQIILNLAVNARDAMPRGGQLILETRNVKVDEAYSRTHDGVPTGEYVMLLVSDNGVGMDGQTQARIFEPFFTTKEPGKGTGLGLATVYGVVKQMGGAIWVHSEPGKGTTFQIYLPRVENKEGETSSMARTPLDSVPSGTETVLLVEDQDGIRDLVREFLRRKGYSVLHAVDGNDALRIAGQHQDQIHLLVTDVVMPNIGGPELVRRLTPLRPQMKVLYMSGFPEHASLGNEEADTDVTVLQKPFMLDALANKIRAVLDNSK
ncbi:MAG TPA: ATP-binding protein [Terriglobales bacterium]|nr:ATP-binding protein [Terriglobales bacterium]